MYPGVFRPLAQMPPNLRKHVRYPRDMFLTRVHSRVNQDIVISEQCALWDQEGSEVLLGKMIIEPTGGSLLYIQPVYLQGEGALKIPQLKRLIMALDDAVVMAPSLEEAALLREAELARKSTRRTQPMPQPTPPDAAVQPPGRESSPPAPPDAKVPGEPPAGAPKPGDAPRS